MNKRDDIGQVIADRYVLKARHKDWGAGDVYAAEHKLLRNPLTVKILDIEELEQPDQAFEHYQTALAATARIENDHMARVSDFGRLDDGRLFIAMEAMQGETLAAVRTRARKLTEAQALTVIQQLAGVLSEAHRLEVLHGDLRPRAVLLRGGSVDDPQIKLLDLGIHQLLPKSTAGRDARYLTPEHARGEPLVAASDIYALGLIAYELVAGAPPFAGAGERDLLTKHKEARPRPLAERAPKVSAGFAAAVERALKKTPKERFANVEQFLAVLEGKEVVTAAEDPAPVIKKPGRTTQPLASPDKGAEPATRLSLEVDSKATLLGYGITAKDVEAEIARRKAAEVDKEATLSYQEGRRAAVETAHEEAAKATKEPAAASSSERDTVTTAAEQLPPPDETTQDIAPYEADAKTVVSTVSQELAKQSAPDEESEAPSSSAPSAAEIPAASASSPEAALLSATAPPQDEGALRARLDEVAQEATEGIESEPYDELAKSQSEWFAEGDAAEQALVNKRDSQPLPAIYGSIDELDLEAPRKLNASTVIIGVIAFATVVLGVIFWTLHDSGEATPPIAKGGNKGGVQFFRGHGGKDATSPKRDAAAPRPDTATAVAAKKSEPDATPAASPDLGAPIVKKAVEPPKVVAPAPKVVAPAPKVVPPKVVRRASPPPAKPRPRARPPRPKPKPAPKPRVVKRAPPRKAPPRKPADHITAAAKLHVNAGRAYLRKGAYSKAKSEFVKALRIDPRNAAARGGLGEVAFELGQYAGASKHLRSALRLTPRNSRYLVMLGNVYFKQGKTKAAVEQYRRALRVNPRSRAARSGLDAALRRMSRGS